MNESSELRTILAEQVERLLADQCSREALLAADGGDWPEALWEACGEAMLTHVLVPEEAGGVGGCWEDAYEVIRLAGHYAAPIPLAEGILARALLARAGLEAPDGLLTIADGGESARLEGDRLTARFARTPWGARAQHLVTLVAGDRGPSVVLAERTALALEAEGRNTANEPRDDLAANGVTVANAPCNLADGALQQFGAMIRSAQIAGAVERVLALSVQYTQERVQFGRPLAKFQAVQQLLAVLAGETTASGTAAQTAFRAADGEGDPLFEIAVAKTRCGMAANEAPKIAHQVHGAIGFTHEHMLHHLTRRLWAWRAEFGVDGHWAAELGRMAARDGGAALWPMLTARSRNAPPAAKGA